MSWFLPWAEPQLVFPRNSPFMSSLLSAFFIIPSHLCPNASTSVRNLLSFRFYWICFLTWRLSPAICFCRMNKTVGEYHSLMLSSHIYPLGSILCSLLCPGNFWNSRAVTWLYKKWLCKLSIVLSIPWFFFFLFHFTVVLELDSLCLFFKKKKERSPEGQNTN